MAELYIATSVLVSDACMSVSSLNAFSSSPLLLHASTTTL
jgi:hypothetical protein